MRLRLLSSVLIVACLLTGPSAAGLTRRQIDSAVATPPIGARLPLDSRFEIPAGGTIVLRDAIGGRPALLIFADFTCPTLCGVNLGLVASVMEETRLTPGRDYSLIVAGIDPRDGASDAESMAAAQIPSADIRNSTVFLMGEAVAELAGAAGFRYVYDARNDAYAHPVGIYVLSPDGRIVRFLSGLDFGADTLSTALTGAAAGTPAPAASPLLLLCYRFDPVTGRYTLSIRRVLAAGGVLTVLLIGSAVALYLLRERRIEHGRS